MLGTFPSCYTCGDGGVLRVLLLSLQEVAEGGEEEPGDADEEKQQAEFLVAVGESEGDALKAGGVSGQLEYPRQLEDAEDLDDILQSAWRHVVRHRVEEESGVVRELGEQRVSLTD